MKLIKLGEGKQDSKFLHLLDLKNLRVLFSKEPTGKIRVEVCETKDEPPYLATLKFSFTISQEEYKAITKKHSGIMKRMMRDLEDLSRAINILYKKRRKMGGGELDGEKA